jgi:hypothetical protein
MSFKISDDITSLVSEKRTTEHCQWVEDTLLKMIFVTKSKIRL